MGNLLVTLCGSLLSEVPFLHSGQESLNEALVLHCHFAVMGAVSFWLTGPGSS